MNKQSERLITDFASVVQDGGSDEAKKALPFLCAALAWALDDTQPSAAGPWIKIEPGCEMPAIYQKLILALGRKQTTTGFWNGTIWLSGFRMDRVWPTHYAVVRMPRED